MYYGTTVLHVLGLKQKFSIKLRQMEAPGKLDINISICFNLQELFYISQSGMRTLRKVARCLSATHETKKKIGFPN